MRRVYSKKAFERLSKLIITMKEHENDLPNYYKLETTIYRFISFLMYMIKIENLKFDYGIKSKLLLGVVEAKTPF